MAAEQSNSSGFAARYATALFELAKETNAVSGVLADLDRFDGLVTSNPDMTRFVMSPVFSADEQLRALENGIDIAVALVHHDSVGVDLPGDVARVEALLAAGHA